MNKQFTASEVRVWERAYNGTGEAKVFGAFADLLEAQEKAEPVAVVKDSDALYTGWLSWTGEPAPPETKLYTHPARVAASR